MESLRIPSSTQSGGELGKIVSFIRKRDYKLTKELGQGACGKTVLLYDDQINEQFVCKKYVPFSETHRQQLYEGFVREIKLLHQIYHHNVVRVFNYYLFPETLSGYIMMEYVDGLCIDDYIGRYPEKVNELFLQAISGFSYLEQTGILHRDIRPQNLMVREDGVLKIIDLGFGKRIETSDDFDKSIDLNWWCTTPEEFKASRYDFKTEVYFVGKLFEDIIRNNDIDHFKYLDALGRMCQYSPSSRIGTFAEVEKNIRSDQLPEIGFLDREMLTYREFSSAVYSHVVRLEIGTKYTTDLQRLRIQLNDAYRRFMLEEYVPDAAVVLRCFFVGQYFYKKGGMRVAVVRDFWGLLKTLPDEKARIILANLHTKFDALPRYTPQDEDDIPF